MDVVIGVSSRKHFARQDRDRQETTTVATAGYHGTAFLVRPVIPSPDLTITTPPPITVTDPTALTATVLPSGPELLALLQELRALRATAPKPPHPATGAPVPKATPAAARGYCWTHGSTANAAHTSATCKNKSPGHQDTATWRNQLSGNAAQYVPISRRPPSSNA
jgi:hypothetical protein